VETLSEPGGFFRSDNFLSNETTYQEVIPELRKRVSPDGVYVGVGPDQNFTYITALRPRMAFIIDIRRQNMLEHLMYKAIIEASPIGPTSSRGCFRGRSRKGSTSHPVQKRCSMPSTTLPQ
jgi:hypothetical protein